MVEVVELGLPVVVADIDPAAGSDRRVLTLIGLDLGEDAPIRRPGSAPRQQRADRAAVDPAAAPGALAGRKPARVVEDGRRRVLVRDHLARDRRLGAATVARRHPDRVGDPQAGLVRVLLAGEDPVLAEVEAVVGEVEDDRSAKLPGALQRAHQAADAAIDGGHRRQRAMPAELDPREVVVADSWQAPDRARLVGHVRLVERGRSRQRSPPEAVEGGGVLRLGVVAAAVRPGPPRAVRGVVREPQEERMPSAGLGADEAGGVAREDVRRVVTGVGAEVAKHAVVAHPVAVVALGLRLREPGLEAGGGSRALGAVVVVQVLADHRGAIARAREPDREGVGFVAERRVAGMVREHAARVGIVTGEEAGAIRAAEGRRGNAVDELGPGADDPAEGLGHVAGLEAVLRLVVGEDDEEVGPARRSPSQRRVDGNLLRGRGLRRSGT